MNNIGNIIKNERLKFNLNQQQLADKLNISYAAISMYERGKRIPELDILIDMSRLFGCTIDYILGNQQNNDDEFWEVIQHARRKNITAKQLKKLLTVLEIDID